MHYKTNRQNHDFQIAYFIAGSCQTPDAAYSILCDLKEDRSTALKSYEAAKPRERAKIIRAERMLADEDEAVRLEGQADLAEISAMCDMVRNNVEAAIAELEFIQKCQDVLQPLRKYAHLPDAVAHEAAQQEEWKLQLIYTAENQLATQGVIGADHYATMRMHPEFATAILPALEATQMLLGQARGGNAEAGAKLVQHMDRRPFALPVPDALLLTHKDQHDDTKG
jgi:hypothetical protein